MINYLVTESLIGTGAFTCRRTSVARRAIDGKLNDERAANPKRADLLRMCECDGVGAEPDDVTFDVTGGIGVRSCLDCGDTRCPGTSNVGKSGIKDLARCESSRRTRHSVDHC